MTVRLSLFALISSALLSACSPSSDSKDQTGQKEASTAQSSEVNVYSYRKEALIKPVLDQFSKQTGIKVNLVTGKADALFTRLQAEGQDSPADILVTTDAGRLHRAKDAGLLQSIESKTLIERIPAHLRDPDNQWYGLSSRARVVFYNKEKVSADELSSYEDLANEKWRGRICIRSSSNIYNQSLMASLIAHNGEEKALAWAKGVVANMARPPKGNDRGQMSGAAIGECDIAIANTYYFGKWLASTDAQDQEYASKVAVFYPNQTGRGAHINVSGAGLVKYSKNKANAIQLLEFLANTESQTFYAQANHEYPVVEGTPVSDIVKSWGYPFKADQLNLDTLGQLNANAVKLFDKAGWE
jgi:iron(III) transport system substrate-binding protein